MPKGIIEKIILKYIRPREEYRFKNAKSSFSEKFRSALKRLYLWLHRELVIRYIPILKEIRKRGGSYKNILEIGSGPIGISEYMKKGVFAIDLEPAGPHYQNMRPIVGNALKVPIKDRSFDLVISMDMLEHMPKDMRQDVINEILRVAKKKVFIGVPCGENARSYESRVRGLYERILEKKRWGEETRDRFKHRNKYLLEHYTCGIPDEDEIRGYISNGCRIRPINYRFNIIDNESLYVWYVWVAANLKHNVPRWIVTAIFFVIFFPILSRIKVGGCYRKIFEIDVE